MKLDVLVKAAQNGTLEMLENMEGLTGAARMELRKALDDLFDVVKSFEKEQKKLIAEASNGGDSIKQDNPRYAFVVKTIRDMLEVEADYKPRGVFKAEFVDGLDCSVAKLRSIEALGLIIAKEASKPGPKPVAKGASGKRK